MSSLLFLCFAEDELKRLRSGFAAQGDDEKMNYILLDYELKDVTINGQTFKKPIIPFGGLNAEEGEPVLPTVTTFYQVAPNKSYNIKVNIQSSEIFENIDILPHQTWDPMIGEATVPFKRNIDLYTSDEPFPKKQASISQIIVFRDLPVVKVAFTPFKYRPLSRQLEIITSADIDLVETGNIEPVQTPTRRSRVFEPLYESIVVNYNRSVSDEDYQKRSILYILPSNSSNLMSNLDILFDWRHKSGYVVNYA